VGRRASVRPRAREYLPGTDADAFAAHERWVLDDVLPWAARELGAREPFVAAGWSNGAAWAIAMGQRRPEVFGRVLALSPGIVPRRVSQVARRTGVASYLAAGTLEEGFLRATQEWSARAAKSGLPVTTRSWVGGHDDACWRAEFGRGLAALVGDRPAGTD
jgi:enterochelin esterase-like enzyme